MSVRPVKDFHIPLHDHSHPTKGGPVVGNGSGEGDSVTSSSGIPGAPIPGVTTLDGLSDVVITSVTLGDRPRFDGTNWVNSALIWKNVMVLDVTSGNYLPVTTGAGEAVYTETL